MPELPDVVVYLEALERRVLGRVLEGVRLQSPFLLRSVDPPLAAALGKRVVGLRRLGKRLVLGFEEELFLVLHLMIAGRLRWRAKGAGAPGRMGLAAFDFEGGTLLLTEAGTKKRASLHVVRGAAGLAAHDRGGLEPLECSAGELAAALGRGRHTLKRALTDPRVLSGIGNAFSDEILHAARLSPFKLSTQLSADEHARLFAAMRAVLGGWLERTRAEVGEGFPEKVTAFREGMAVHGRYREPCPDCGAPVQRVVYATKSEMNYCARCQTEGRMLADRALSTLMKDDWPRTIEEWEEPRRRPDEPPG